jgi:hypothetical protein
MRKIGATLAVLLLSACGSGGAPRSNTSPAPPHENEGFGHTMIEEVTPLPAGGAYATTITGEVWYLSGIEAVRVKEVPHLSSATAAQPPNGNTAFLLASWTVEKHRVRAAKRELEATAESGGAASEE